MGMRIKLFEILTYGGIIMKTIGSEVNMERQNNCRFCNIANGIVGGMENVPLWESDGFFTLASIGAFVPGWVLLIPKPHTLSMKNVYHDAEFKGQANNILSTLRAKYKEPIITFEHGASHEGSCTSCGTEHAHLHFVPYANSLINGMNNGGMKWLNCTPNQIDDFSKGNEYLFYAELQVDDKWENAKGKIHILEKPSSQYFRRLIAQQLDCLEKYDYKEYPRIEQTIDTYNILTHSMASL
jgi:diadenosine tetraphosphate (Ap4A) HIT family hydrolase